MQQIQSDAELRAALSGMEPAQQRSIAKRFVENVIDLSDNPKVGQALLVIDDPEATEAMLGEPFKAAKSAAIDAYTLCGRDADWLRQAGHFVAAAAAVCLCPQPAEEAANRELAWETAMNTRMARNCEKIAHGKESDDSEAQAQYRILSGFLS